MKLIYWPRDEYDCTEASRRLARPDTVHLHCDSDSKALAELLRHRAGYHCSAPGGEAEDCAVRPVCLYHSHKRYWCITGPNGLVRGVIL